MASSVRPALVILAQLTAALAVAAAEAAVTGGVGLVAPIFALSVGGVGAFWGIGRRLEGWPKRPAILRTALWSGATFWLLSTTGYLAAYAAQPAAFDFSARALVLLAPVVGCLPGLSALVLTMCAGDAAATALKSYDELQEAWEVEGADLYARFSSPGPTRYGYRHGNRDRAKISRH
ncbi:MAG: hypothetical protein ACI8S6_004215 [Myxococcota bacterium]|jgi:hypothetical protein